MKSKSFIEMIYTTLLYGLKPKDIKIFCLIDWVNKIMIHKNGISVRHFANYIFDHFAKLHLSEFNMNNSLRANGTINF